MGSMTDTLTGTEWLKRHNVEFDWSATGYQVEDGWEHHAYVLTLARDGASVEIPWKQGLGIDDAPSPASTLWAIASDVRYGEMDWHEFAGEFGYDELEAPLSQYRTWEACREQSRRLEEFLTEAAFSDLRNITEGSDDA